MFLVHLTLWTLLGSATESDASALVSRLGAGRYAQRRAAAEALERLGRPALPALRKARAARDPEVRARAAELVERIESGLMVRPTLVRLDYRERPLPEVVADLSRQSGMSLTLDPEGIREWTGRRVTLREPGPLPFWDALDRLCREARLHFEVGPRLAPGVGEPTLGVELADGVEPGASWNSGPFRVELVSLDYQRHRQVKGAPRGPEPPGASEQFQAQVLIQAEPRLLIAPAGPLRLIEAVDDRGQSLALPAEGEAGDEPSFDFAPVAPLHAGVELKYPERPGRWIRRLRGTIPLVVAARQAEPLVIPLADAGGKTFRRGDLTVSVGSIRPEPNEAQTLIDLTFERGGAPGATGTGPVVPSLFLEQQVEVRDGRGRPFVLFPQETTVHGGEVRMTLALSPSDGASAPAQLRYYGLTRARAEVTFEFADVRMP
jgi:hypothetical protein